MPAAVHVVFGIGIVTTIGVPETKAPAALTLIVVEAVTLSSRTCVAGLALAAAMASHTRDGIWFRPALKMPRS